MGSEGLEVGEQECEEGLFGCECNEGVSVGQRPYLEIRRGDVRTST